ncbi:MAG: hypothetical protein COA37_09015, partial [Hoeflea sp.]
NQQTSKAAKGHKIYPYLLRGLRVDRPNQVWFADISYLPMQLGFLYLVAIMDWHTRKVLAWRILNTLETGFCVEALNEAIHKFGSPEIMNTDQGSQFTSFAWTDRLRRSSVRISMDGKVRFLDNIFVERLWRSLKYECVYLHAWEPGSDAKAGIRNWMDLLHHQTPTRGPWRQATCRGLLVEKRRSPTRSAGSKSRLIYVRYCPRDGGVAQCAVPQRDSGRGKARRQIRCRMDQQSEYVR